MRIIIDSWPDEGQRQLTLTDKEVALIRRYRPGSVSDWVKACCEMDLEALSTEDSDLVASAQGT